MTTMCIYDDDIEFSLLFEKLLYRYAEENDKEIDVEIFQGGENAALQIAQNEYDILFLDIDLGDVKGFEIGKQIRDELKNNKIQIVYISGDTSYAMELFNTRPFDFVVKPVEKKKLFKMLDTYFSIFSGKNKYLHYRWLKQDHIIKQDNIIYLQSIGRKVVAKTFDGDVEFYDKLSKVIDKLDDNKFCRVHKSFVINSIYVDVFKSDKVIMCDSAWIPINKSYKKSFREWLVKHNA